MFAHASGGYYWSETKLSLILCGSMPDCSRAVVGHISDGTFCIIHKRVQEPTSRLEALKSNKSDEQKSCSETEGAFVSVKHGGM